MGVAMYTRHRTVSFGLIIILISNKNKNPAEKFFSLPVGTRLYPYRYYFALL